MISLPASLVISVLAAHGGDARAPVELAADAAARLRHEPVAELVAEARAALDAKDFEAAREAAARAARRAPADGEAWRLLGLALFRDGRPADAVPAFTRAAAIQPRSAILRFNLGSALLEAERGAEAERAYLEAARLDGKVAPLALLDAGLAAQQANDDEGAADHFHAAADAARSAGAAPLVERAAQLLIELERARAARIRARVHALARAGKVALSAERPAEAAAAYRAALESAARDGLSDADCAELQYALGHALYKMGDVKAAGAAFASAVAFAPREAELRFMLGVARFRLESDGDAERAFEAALALGLGDDDAQHARAYLRAIAARAHVEKRLTVDARVGGGWDSNVPQSNQVVVTGTTPADPGAGLLSADLDVTYRPVGTARSGITFEYRFGQLAYLSSDLDTYSLQEHDLSAALAHTFFKRLKLEAGFDGYLLFAGLQTFNFFQSGLALGPRVTVDEGHGFELRSRYVHIFKSSLDPNYNYLGGARDEAVVTQSWRNKRLEFQLGYQFTSEAIGAQVLGSTDIIFPQGVTLPADATYTIPYSFSGHEALITGAVNMPWALHAQLTFRYEHRDYPKRSFVFDPIALRYTHLRARVDDRYTLDATLRRPIWGPFDCDLAYTLVVNRSTIDFTNPATPFDYDNKNYFKHVVVVEFSYLY